MTCEALDEVLPRLVDHGLPDGGEFLVAELSDDEHTVSVIALLIWHGFLPMGGYGMLLPKIHKIRCIMPPGDVHIGRKVRKKAKGFHLSIDKNWAEVVANIQQLTFTKHKGDCWLSDELADAYSAVGRLPVERRHGVLFHSVELWHTASGRLAAGEIGYTCGGVYSSCTGFALKDEYPGAGSVQLAALGRWLERCGFAIWDLGMELDYKLELGCKPVSRAEWADRMRQAREANATELRDPVGADADAQGLLSAGVAANEAARGDSGQRAQCTGADESPVVAAAAS